MRPMVGGIGLVLALASLLGCAGRAGRPPEPDGRHEDLPEPVKVRREAVPLPGQSRHLPSQDPRHRASGPERLQLGERASTPPAPAAPPAQAPEPARDEGRRYRVQILATISPDKAEALRREIGEYMGLETRVDQEGGIWKVRVGDLRDRDAAEDLRRRLVDRGFRDALVVASGGR